MNATLLAAKAAIYLEVFGKQQAVNIERVDVRRAPNDPIGFTVYIDDGVRWGMAYFSAPQLIEGLAMDQFIARRMETLCYALKEGRRLNERPAQYR